VSESPVTAPAEESPAGAGEGAVGGSPTPAHRARRLLRRSLRIGFVLLAVALGAYAVAREWTQVRAGLADLGLLATACALVAVLAGLLCTMQLWRGLLAALGSPLPMSAGARIFFVGQLGKYIPGSMWSVLAQMDLARAYRVPRRRSGTVALLTMLISLCAGLLAALVALPLLGGPATAGYRWVFLFAPALLACLHPRVVNPLVDRLLRLARRQPLERPLTGRAVAAALAWALVSWIMYGLHVWLLAVRLGASPAHALPLAIGGFAFAWSVGFLTVFAPAGAGIREVLLIATLAPVLNVGRATVVALVSRVLMTAGDLLLAALAAWSGRRVGEHRN
jgi:glycosyltransferase 2 family protein